MSTDSSGSTRRGDRSDDGSIRAVYLLPPDDAYPGDSHSLDITALISTLWRGKWIVMLVTTICALAAVVYALNATEWYRASILLAPASDDVPQSSSFDLGGLAAFAGLAGVGNSQIRTAEPLAILTSRDFIEKFLVDHELIFVVLGAQSRWWRPQEDADAFDAVEFFRDEILEIRENDENGLVEVFIRWIDAAAAADWANLLVRELNDRMRQKSLNQATAYVSFLRQELNSASQIALQQVIGSLLERELQKAMLARVNEEFAFRVVDDADIPRRRYWPKRTQLVLLSAVSGATLGILIVLMIPRLRRRGQDTA